jgi:hypothetical protein
MTAKRVSVCLSRSDIFAFIFISEQQYVLAEKRAEEALYLSEEAAISRFGLGGRWRQGCHLHRFRGT